MLWVARIIIVRLFYLKIDRGLFIHLVLMRGTVFDHSMEV